MATATVSISSTVTPGVTLSNPVSLDELQLLGSPTVTVDSTATIDGLLGLDEGRYEIVEPTSGDGATSGAALRAAYDRLSALTPSAAYRATLILMPGTYDIASTSWLVDTDYVDIIGIGPYGSVIIKVSGGFAPVVSTDEIYVKNIYFDDGFSSTATGTGGVFVDCVLDFTGSVVGGSTFLQNFYNCDMVAIGRGSSWHTFSGSLDNCRLSGSSTVYLAATSQVRHSTIVPTLNAASAINCSVYLCALAAALGGNITNDIAAPQNVVDADVAI